MKDQEHQNMPDNVEDVISQVIRVLSNNHELIKPVGTKEKVTSDGNDEENKISYSEEKQKTLDRVDAVIIVAIPEEKKGVFNAFGIPPEQWNKSVWNSEYNFRYYQFYNKGLSMVLLMPSKMGMTVAASLATRAILAFRPKLIAMAGICGGRYGKTNLGDIVVASKVFDHTAGKHYADRFAFRPDSIPLDDAIADIVSNTVLADEEFVGKIQKNYGATCPSGKIKVHYAPIASGTAVIDNAQVVDGITKAQDDMVGIDMEAYGLACAAKVFGTKWIVAKAVQDFANGTKSETEENVRSFAAYASAKLLHLIMDDLMEVVRNRT